MPVICSTPLGNRLAGEYPGKLKVASLDELRRNVAPSRLWMSKIHLTLRSGKPYKITPTSAAVSGYSSDEIPSGCSRVKVELTRPLGMVLEENKNGVISVVELVAGGNAEKSGQIQVGDELIATSAIVYNTEESYGGVLVRKGMEVVRLAVRGERFDTVMAAIRSHPAYMQVTVELQKCQPET